MSSYTGDPSPTWKDSGITKGVSYTGSGLTQQEREGADLPHPALYHIDLGDKMTEQELIEKVAAFLTTRFIGNPDRLPGDECLKEARQIHAFYQKVGYVKLAKDQSIDLSDLAFHASTEHLEFRVVNIMLKDGFRKVEV